MDKTIIRKIKRQMTLKADEKADMRAYNDICEMRWDGIPDLVDKEWYVEFKDPTGRDMIQQAVNIYATHNPKWEVMPIGMGEIDEAEKKERWFEWQMQIANSHGEEAPFPKMLTHSTKFNMICVQLDYRPYWDKSEDAKKYPFCIKPYEPTIIYDEYGSYDEPLWVAVVNNIHAVDVIEFWSEYSEGDARVKSSIDRVEALVKEDPEQRMMYIDYTDNKKRWVYCYPVPSDVIDESLGEDFKRDIIDIMDKKNALGFINWAIARGEGDALLSPLHKGNLWMNINRSETLKRSIAFRRAFYPLFIEEGLGGTQMDYSGDQDIAKVPTNTKLTPILPPPLDPAFNELSAQDRAMMTRSVGMDNMGGFDASNVQFATINAIIQLRLSILEPYKRTFEKACRRIATLMPKWLEATKDTVTSYRTSTSKPDVLMRGEELSFSSEDFIEGKFFVDCTVLPNNPTDRMQRVNEYSLLKQNNFPVPDSEYVERFGFGSPEVLLSRYEDQQLASATLQAKIKEIIGEADVKIAALQAKAQFEIQAQAQQGQAPPEKNPTQPATTNAQGQGFDAARGGEAPMTPSPEMTQTALRGMSQ
jgi:hypothetical protein